MRELWFYAIVAISSLHMPGWAAPVKGGVATTEHPGDVAKQPPLKDATYGLCEAPQNADAFPSSPVSVEPGKCYNSQTFSAMSNTPSTGGSCGGFTVVFGPKGDLKPNLDNVTLAADWGDIAPRCRELHEGGSGGGRVG